MVWVFSPKAMLYWFHPVKLVASKPIEVLMSRHEILQLSMSYYVALLHPNTATIT